MSRLQNEDFKSEAQLVAAGGAKAQLLNDTKIYVTGNGINDTLFNAIQAGSIGGGGGSKNYITTGATFENNATTGWSLAATTLSNKFPNQVAGSWTAAAGTLSLTTVGSGSQLAGNYSASLASSAASTAGNMMVSNAITLDQEAQGAVLGISFYYKVASGAANLDFSGSSNNSLAVAIYDVTNSAWIQPAGTYNLVNKSTVGRFTGTFQVPTNTTQVRLAIFFPNASAGSFGVTLDDFVLGPQTTSVAPAMSDYQSYTPTFTGFGTVSSVTCYWARIGNRIRIYGKFLTGTPTAAIATFSLPSGLTNADTQGQIGGEWWRDITTGGGAVKRGTLPYSAGSNVVGFSWDDATQAVSPASQQLGTAIVGASQMVFFWFDCPITGWSSNTVSSADTDTRVVAMQATSSGQSIANGGADVQITGLTTSVDTAGAFSSNAYTVATTGFYLLSAQSNYNSASTGIQVIKYKINSATSVAISAAQNLSQYQVFGGTTLLQLNSGDILRFYLANSGAAAYTTDLVRISLNRLSGPAVVQATETVAMSVNTSTTSITNGGTSTIIFTNKLRDTHNAYNASTGVYTIPVSGSYFVSSFIDLAMTVSNNYNLVVQVAKNASATLSAEITGSTNSFGGSAGTGPSGILPFLAGDQVTVVVYQVSGASRTPLGTDRTYFTLARVGN
jgi:hypothetical protein